MIHSSSRLFSLCAPVVWLLVLPGAAGAQSVQASRPGAPSDYPQKSVRLVVRKGRQANVPTPANEAIVRIDRHIRRGALKPDRSNLALVEAMIR